MGGADDDMAFQVSEFSERCFGHFFANSFSLICSLPSERQQYLTVARHAVAVGYYLCLSPAGTQAGSPPVTASGFLSAL